MLRRSPPGPAGVPADRSNTCGAEKSKLDGLKDLSPEQIRERIGAIVERIEKAAAKSREESGSGVLGAAAVGAQNSFDRPAKPKKSPAPLFHAFTRRVRRE